MKSHKNIRLFAATVRSSAQVRQAFRGNGVLQLWWTCVLGLHGKPVQLKVEEYLNNIAAGFRFYGFLYRTLALFLAAFAVANCFLRLNGYWSALLLISSIYLWIVSGLAFSGAAGLRIDSHQARWKLTAFLHFVAMFLVGTLAAISIYVEAAELIDYRLNVACLTAFLALGVGSYMIEMAALVLNPAGAART